MRHKRAILYTVMSALEDGPLRVTHLMYTVNTSAERLKQYLIDLREGGLVERVEIGKDVFYLLTPAGKQLCESYRKLQEYEQ